jgi:hypothetical protein
MQHKDKKTGTLKKEGLCNMIRDMQKKVPVADLFAADGVSTDDEKVQQTAAKIMRKVEQVEEGRFDSLRFEDFAKIASDPTYGGVFQSPRYKRRSLVIYVTFCGNFTTDFF